MQLLIAHEDAQVRAALARAIAGGSDPDLEVVELREGLDALELLLQEDAPRLAVVDWDMPGLEGPELCRIVRHFNLGGPPYIVLLASQHHPDVEEGLAAGANDCIRTPAGADEIRERVQAGMSFVEVPWERAARGASLDAVRTNDDEDPLWNAAEDRGGGSGSQIPTQHKVELEAVLVQN